jgi:stage II sporulation protein M
MRHLNLRRGFLAATVIFVLSIAAGWAFAQEAEPLLRPGLENLLDAAEKSARINPEFRSLALTSFIFLKNLSVAAILVLVGHVVFALPTIFILGINGTLIGLLARVFIESGIPPLAFVAGIAPHGVIELPALLLAAGFAFALMARRIGGKPAPGVGNRFGFLLRVIAPPLLLAAVLEVYLTPLVLAQFLPEA